MSKTQEKGIQDVGTSEEELAELSAGITAFAANHPAAEELTPGQKAGRADRENRERAVALLPSLSEEVKLFLTENDRAVILSLRRELTEPASIPAKVKTVDATILAMESILGRAVTVEERAAIRAAAIPVKVQA